MLPSTRSIAALLVALCALSGLAACNGNGNSGSNSGRDLYMLVLRDAGGSIIRVRTSSNGSTFSQKATITGMAPS